MPLSAMADYTAAHWDDVRSIFSRAITAAGMRPQMVSDSLEADIIHTRIVGNLYSNPVVVCDVSGLNPNVMFELGMRLTFNKPTIIVTDNVGALPFDTRVVEHLIYSRELHFHKVEKFIENLSSRIVSIHELAESGKYRSFIDTLGPFETVRPEAVTVSSEKFLMERLEQLLTSVRRLERKVEFSPSAARVGPRIISDRSPIDSIGIPLGDFDPEETARKLSLIPGVYKVHQQGDVPNMVTIDFDGRQRNEVFRSTLAVMGMNTSEG